MKRFEVGKLYSCSEHFLMLYPDKETASAGAAFATSSTRAAALAVYWSEEFGKPVSYINRNEPFLVLCTSGLQAEVLNGDKRGWFVNDGRLAHHVEPV
jgi:hypothetical protein